MLSSRPMVDRDVPSALSLSRLAGWNQTKDDWELFLALSPTGCFVAVDDDDNVHGTVATVRYQNHFSWIGMVLVHPSMQRRGVGSMLLRKALQQLTDEETIKLDATPAGRQIYLPLDFRDEYTISRMEVADVSRGLLNSSTKARPFREGDLEKLLALDRQVFGADRTVILDSLQRRAPRFAFVLEEKEMITGYCLGREGERFTHIGPVVARDVDAARDLCMAALRNSPDRAVIIDAPAQHDAWIGWLASVGFREQRRLVRMYRGSNRYPGSPEKQFAILGPELG